MTVFSSAIDVIFADDNMAVSGTLTPATGAASSVRVLLSRPEEAEPIFGVGAIVGKYKAEIRTSQLAALVEGDTLTIGATNYTVENPLVGDADRLLWFMELGE